ncbi:MAG: hypothetical protein HY069_03095, partial [Chlamydiia bacterium]|nr:hypothetical protein [Chlamydiia bacterium]
MTNLCEEFAIPSVDPSGWIGQANKYALVALKQLEQADRIEAAPPRKIQSDLFTKYISGSSVALEIQRWDINQEHTIPIPDYLRVRISDAILHQMRLCGNVDVFVGSSEDMQKFYAELGFRILGEMCTNSSIRFFLVQSRSDPKVQKVVACNVVNDSKLVHLLLELRYSKIDMETVLVRGNVAMQRALCAEMLQNEFFNHVPHDVDIAFIGTRAQILIEMAKRFYPLEMADATAQRNEKATAEHLLGKKHRLRTTEELGGVFSYSLVEMEIQGKKWSIIALKMPNGDLAYPATAELIRRGVRNFVLLGAGGSLDESAALGSYQLIQSTVLRDGTQIDLDRIPPLPVHLPGVPVHRGRKNETVLSPLEETGVWHQRALQNKVHSVDCETYHIARALHEASGVPIRIFPGLFTSDVIGYKPLTNKVGATAHTHLSTVVQCSLDSIEMPKSLGPELETDGPPPSIQLDPAFLPRSEAILRSKIGEFADFLRWHLRQVDERLQTLNLMFAGKGLPERLQACSVWHDMRKYLILETVRRHIIPALKKEGIAVDTTCCIFTHTKFRDRHYSVAGTFALIMIIDLNSPGKKIVNGYLQQLREIGMRVDCRFVPRQHFKPTPYHLLHLNQTWMIGGAEDLGREIFVFSDQQLAEAFCALIGKKDGAGQIGARLQDESYKEQLMSALLRLAGFEQYKKDLEAFPADPSIAPYPFKQLLNGMADLLFTLGSNIAISLEWLGVTLSNIISRQKSRNGVHPLLRSEEETAVLTIKHVNN